jgi:hypothetical protein
MNLNNNEQTTNKQRTNNEQTTNKQRTNNEQYYATNNQTIYRTIRRY